MELEPRTNEVKAKYQTPHCTPSIKIQFVIVNYTSVNWGREAEKGNKWRKKERGKKGVRESEKEREDRRREAEKGRKEKETKSKLKGK